MQREVCARAQEKARSAAMLRTRSSACDASFMPGVKQFLAGSEREDLNRPPQNRERRTKTDKTAIGRLSENVEFCEFFAFVVAGGVCE